MDYGDGKMNIAVSVPDDVFREAECLAQRMGVSSDELFRIAVEAYVRSHAHDGVRESLDAIYAEESSKVDEVLAAMQWASMPREQG